MHFTDANMLVTEAYMHVADAYMHFTDSNMRADTATTLNCQILIRAHPFEHMPFHGKCRQDFVTWRTTYSGIQPDQFDLDNPVSGVNQTPGVLGGSVEVHCTQARLPGRRIQVPSLLQHATQPCVLRGGH